MINNVVLLGNLTRDPELKYAPSGAAICNLTLALNHKYKSGDTIKEEVNYIDVVVFGKTAEATAEYLNKGSKAAVIGRLKQDRWQTEDGKNRSKVRVVADSVKFLDSNKKDTTQTQGGDTPL